MNRGTRTLVNVSTGLLAAAGLLWLGGEGLSWAGGVALVALAAVAGVLATAGVPRRAVGVLVALVGAGVLGLVAFSWNAAATPYLPAAAGVALLGSGVLVTFREPRLPRWGARYTRGQGAAVGDPDRTAWSELDAGRDPTDDGASPRTARSRDGKEDHGPGDGSPGPAV